MSVVVSSVVMPRGVKYLCYCDGNCHECKVQPGPLFVPYHGRDADGRITDAVQYTERGVAPVDTSQYRRDAAVSVCTGCGDNIDGFACQHMGHISKSTVAYCITCTPLFDPRNFGSKESGWHLGACRKRVCMFCVASIFGGKELSPSTYQPSSTVNLYAMHTTFGMIHEAMVIDPYHPGFNRGNIFRLYGKLESDYFALRDIFVSNLMRLLRAGNPFHASLWFAFTSSRFRVGYEPFDNLSQNLTNLIRRWMDGVAGPLPVCAKCLDCGILLIIDPRTDGYIVRKLCDCRAGAPDGVTRKLLSLMVLLRILEKRGDRYIESVHGILKRLTCSRVNWLPIIPICDQTAIEIVNGYVEDQGKLASNKDALIAAASVSLARESSANDLANKAALIARHAKARFAKVSVVILSGTSVLMMVLLWVVASAVSVTPTIAATPAITAVLVALMTLMIVARFEEVEAKKVEIKLKEAEAAAAGAAKAMEELRKAEAAVAALPSSPNMYSAAALMTTFRQPVSVLITICKYLMVDLPIQ